MTFFMILVIFEKKCSMTPAKPFMLGPQNFGDPSLVPFASFMTIFNQIGDHDYNFFFTWCGTAVIKSIHKFYFFELDLGFIDFKHGI